MKLFSLIHCEAKKILSSSVFWVVLVAFATMPIMLGLSTYISAGADWATYINDLLGTCTALLVVGFSFTAAWVFGREYADRTITELLVKPASRLSMVLAKFISIFVWDVLLSFFMFTVVLTVGFFIGLDGLSWTFIGSSFLLFLGACLMIMTSSTVMALLANVTKGYLAPIGLTFLIVVVSNVVAELGFAPYFSWTIPSLFIAHTPLMLPSYIILFMTGIVGFTATVSWWMRGEQS
ncbi:MAG: ABC transporter permease [Acetatifactor sp.]|nr:ABC transporter permease [Acetatifactor sp.]